MVRYILAHDLGTSGDKATLFSSEGELVRSAFTPYETIYPRANWAEQDPACYWEGFCRSTKKILEEANIKPTDIAVVSFSGQMMAALPVDREGQALRNSIIWADLRSTKQADDFGSRIDPERVYEVTGHRLSGSYSATKIMWIRDNEPDIYKRAFKFIHAKDYLASKLTGVIHTDYSDASGMNLMDLKAHTWSDELIDAAGIDREKLPEMIESIDITGTVRSEAAAASSLVEGTPVVIGAGDGPCATCGAGVVREGDSYIYLGTSTWMGLASRTPVIDPEKRTNTFNHFLKDLYMPAGSMQAGGGSLKWFKDTLCGEETLEAEKKGVDVYDLLLDRAADLPPGSGPVVFLPYLMGERSPLWDPDARGCFIGLSMVCSKYHMLRAVLEGVAFNMRIIDEAFAEQGAGGPVIRFIGGGAKSGLWRQIFADVTGKKIARLNYIEEATSIGAAIAGGVGVGMFSSLEEADRFIKIEEEIEPDPAGMKICEKHYSLFKKSYERLRELFPDFTEYS